MREERARVQYLPVVKELVLRILSGHVIHSLEYSRLQFKGEICNGDIIICFL